MKCDLVVRLRQRASTHQTPSDTIFSEAADALELAQSAVLAMANDGWLDHGAEGMSVAQEKCYAAYLAIIGRNAV